MGKDIHFETAADAADYCRRLVETGAADLFRGQTNDWPTISPSLLRGDVNLRKRAAEALESFREWANIVPQMAIYHGQLDAITAIAQHYGIPTPFLDLTTDPGIAELFARAAEGDDLSGGAVIYCFKRADLERLAGFKLVEIDVVNLWRLETQRGLFLEYRDEESISEIRDIAIRLHFPRKTILVTELVRLYPLRKSALEIVIDQWIYRNQITRMFSEILEDVSVHIRVRRYTYPGAFRWRAVPEFTPEWISHNAAWVFPLPERIKSVVDPKLVPITVDSAMSAGVIFDTLMEQFRAPISDYVGNREAVEFQMKVSGHEQYSDTISLILNRCWDGIRNHPYAVESGIRCMAATALALAWPLLFPDANNWEAELWGDVEFIDAAPVGGHLDAAAVSGSALRGAQHTLYDDALTKYMRRRQATGPYELMDYVVDPWVLFDFERLSVAFVEQFIPSCIGGYWKESLAGNDGMPGELWGLSFNPALLAFVTRFGFRFHSPIAVEHDVETLILVTSDMTEEEIEEVFISCMPAILAGGEPYVVKFTDHAGDERELWEIDSAIEQCKTILRIGGISVLDVFPGARDPDEPPTGKAPGGLGAFHIWAIAKGRLSDVNGTPLASMPELMEEFWRDLMHSNGNLEERAKSQVDWPT